MAEDEQTSKKCFRCQKSEPGEGGVLCAGCLTEITGFVVPWDDVIANSKQLSSQYALRR
ncbi:hypothetical protein AB0F91_46930 [Amycolatopsis sp. NPDC023774]|uniref:hypothetical protein n=1 Tax=Amycolatopsis sp. NPDC023774 TaxID=3155015 RepID=UPI00340B9E8A